MSFGAWLRTVLVDDEVIEADVLNSMMDPLSAEDLMECTELDLDDIENYKTDYQQCCESDGDEPDYHDWQDYEE